MKNMLGDNEALRNLLNGLLYDLLSKLNGENGTQWEAAFKRFLRKENPWEGKIISINRSKPFDPVAFLGNSWSIFEQDDRSLSLTEVDLNKVLFEIMLKDGETRIVGEEKLRRLKASGNIRLDAKIFQTLWESQSLIPESWKEKINGNTRYIFFDGTVLRRPRGYRYVLYLFWHDGRWHWGYRWLVRDWCAGSPSAVLASNG